MSITPEELFQSLRSHARRAYEKLPNNRAYALTDDALDALGSLGVAQWEANGGRFDEDSLGKMIAELADITPDMLQPTPDTPPKLPEPWLDPVTGEMPKNPFSDPPDLESQTAIARHDPVLAEHLRATKYGTTYKYLAQLADQKAAANRVAAIKYDAKTHATNPWREGGNATEQAAIVKDNPELGEVMKREAQPVRLPFSFGAINHTGLARLTARAESLGALANRAIEIQRQRVSQKLNAARHAENEAARQRREAENLLKGNK